MDYWHTVQEIFAAALQRDGEARVHFLDVECAGNSRMRREVERLLVNHDSAGDFLESPALQIRVTESALHFPAPPDRDLGQTVGAYRLDRLIGQGGMGAVYLGVRIDDAYRQQAAIKLIAQDAEDEQSHHRFRNERQILAALQHPNIGRLFDGGTTEDGRPYLVMEYIEGRRIDAYCKDEDLVLEERLLLFQRVCAAVGFAHRSLLVHRDLKPSNILVTADGVPKLLDFGIAKSLAPEADGGRTRTGQQPMTPAYASPEQIRSKAPITTASDVYSLGVVLYELLTGTKPYRLEDDSDFTLQEAILEQDPIRASLAVTVLDGPLELQRRLQGDLDTILLKALRKEPEARYASVEALSEDLQKFLDDLPVSARGDALPYRWRKFARRNRVALALAGVVAMVVVGFVVALAQQSRIATQQRDRAEQALSFMTGAFKASDPEQAQGREVTAREILDQGAAKVRRELANEPDLQATLLGAMGEVYLSLGIFDEAEALLLEVDGLSQGTEGEAQSAYLLGELEWGRRDYRAAEEHYRRSLALSGRFPLAKAQNLRGLGLALVRQGQQDESESRLNEALQAFREAGLSDQDDEVLRCVNGLAAGAMNRGFYETAALLYRQVVDGRRQGGAGPNLGRSLAGLGVALRRVGQLEEASKAFEEALPVLQNALGGSENVYVAEVLGEMIVLRLELDAREAGKVRGDQEDTERLLREILAMQGTSIPTQHPTIAEALHNLAPILASRGEFAEATEVGQRALQLRRDLFGEIHEEIAASLCSLGRIAQYAGDFPTARMRLEECAAVLGRMHPGGHPLLAFPLLALGEIEKAESGCAAAEPWFRRAFDIRREYLGADHFHTKQTAEHLKECQSE